MRVTANQDLSPEERRAVDLFREEFADAVDATLADAIVGRIRRGHVPLSSDRAIRQEIGRFIDDFRGELEAGVRVAGKEAARAGRATAIRRLGLQLDFDRLPRETLDALEDWSTTVSESVPTTIEDELTNYLRGAHEEGLSVDEIADDLNEEFFEGRLKGSKAEQLARDNTVGPSNAGRHSAHEEATGVVAEQWLAELDADTRDTHAEAHGQVVSVENDFRVGGYPASHPHDPRLPVEESTQCRCTVVGVLSDELTDDELAEIASGGRVWK